MKASNKHGFLAVILTVMLVAVMMLSLAACNQSEQNSTTVPSTQGPTEGTTGGETSQDPTTDSQDKTEIEYPTIKGDMLSWDYLNSVPVKTANMDITAARKLCVDFFRVSKSALWIPDTDWKATDSKGKVLRSMEGGKIYAGLPYVTMSGGNIYRLMDYINPETGVVNITEAGKKHELFGNQCSYASYWGWGRVVNSAAFSWTNNILHTNGFLRIGPYTYDDKLTAFSSRNRTTHILEANGRETMYQSYAELKAGDGVVYYTTAGHIVMISRDAYVKYKADGTIDANKSYVYVIDQAGEWEKATNKEGDNYIFSANTDKKWTFFYLYEHDYIPFTFAEWLGTDPIEETEITYSHTGDTITLDQLWGSKVTCNYGLADMYAIIKDNEGNEVYKVAVRSVTFAQKIMQFSKTVSSNVIWGSEEDLDKNKQYTVEIVAQIATGERPTLWSGALVQ